MKECWCVVSTASVHHNDVTRAVGADMCPDAPRNTCPLGSLVPRMTSVHSGQFSPGVLPADRISRSLADARKGSRQGSLDHVRVALVVPWNSASSGGRSSRTKPTRQASLLLCIQDSTDRIPASTRNCSSVRLTPLVQGVR